MTDVWGGFFCFCFCLVPSKRVQFPLGDGMLPQAQPEPSRLSWDLAGGLVTVISQMWHWELWGFSTAV